MMSAVTKHDFVFLLHLVSLSTAAAAIVAVFFGAGFLLLAPPHPAAPLKDPAPEAQALQVAELQSPEDNDAAEASLSALSPHEVATSPMLSVLSERELPPLGSPETRTALVTPAHITHAKKKIRVRQRRHEATARNWAVLWRPDASAGPNPGGGFYGAPNFNVGYINPR
jgi:hypothetical protein